jgi:DNA-binding LytR/AlgR family response regulator
MLIKTVEGAKRANIHLDRIMYVESDKNHVIFHMADGMLITCYMTLTKAHELFPELERISQSFIINEKELRSVVSLGHSYTFKISNGEKIRVSKGINYLKEFFKKYDR